MLAYLSSAKILAYFHVVDAWISVNLVKDGGEVTGFETKRIGVKVVILSVSRVEIRVQELGAASHLHIYMQRPL